MIRGVHTMFYSSRPAELRSFLRDTLGFTAFTDVGDGWLIFSLPEAEMGVHPATGGKGGSAGRHDISFYCDDIDATVAELKGRGVKFIGKVADREYGRIISFKMPGKLKAELYQPRYALKTPKGRSRRTR